MNQVLIRRLMFGSDSAAKAKSGMKYYYSVQPVIGFEEYPGNSDSCFAGPVYKKSVQRNDYAL